MLRCFASALAGLCFSVGIVSSAFAQQMPSKPAPVNPNPSTGSNLFGFFSSRTPYEFWLTCLIGLIGLTVIGLLVWSVTRSRNYRPDELTRPVIIVTVIIGTLILVTAGYSNEQIAPAFGLFGTIVGYILGRLTPPPSSQSGSSTDVPAPPPDKPKEKPPKAPEQISRSSHNVPQAAENKKP
jgi:hypothetical protein